MSREYRVLLSPRYSSRWVNRLNKIKWLDEAWHITDIEYMVVDDIVILCDLCNHTFPDAYDAAIPILQHRWGTSEPWYDVGTRCAKCLIHETTALEKMGYSIQTIPEAEETQ